MLAGGRWACHVDEAIGDVTMSKFKDDLTLKTIKDMVYGSDLELLTQEEKMHIIDFLGSLLWDIGCVWDKTKGVDPRKGPYADSYGGTRNHRSMTYKLRKIAGYSYP